MDTKFKFYQQHGIKEYYLSQKCDRYFYQFAPSDRTRFTGSEPLPV